MTNSTQNIKTPADIFDMKEITGFSSIMTDEERRQLDRLTVKRVDLSKDENGCPVYSFSLYLDDSLVADISHEKYGASPNVDYSADGESMMISFIQEGKWDSRLPVLMYNSEEIVSCTSTLTSELANAPIAMWEQEVS